MSLPRPRARPITPIVPSGPRRPPLAITEARCNRCGACFALGCPAIEDAGGEAHVIDPVTCTGCALCAPLCRARAIGPALRVLGSASQREPSL